MPVHRARGGEWKPINYDFARDGVPYPSYCGDLLEHLGYCGESQAWAIAFWYKAQKESESWGEIEIDVQKKLVSYSFDIVDD